MDQLRRFVSQALDVRTYVPIEPSRSLTVKYFITGIILPCLCYWIALSSNHIGINQPWQSGGMEDYVTLLLSSPAILIFLPIKVFAMAGLAEWLFRPQSREYLWVKTAIGGGVLLSLQVLVLSILHIQMFTFIAAAIFGGTLAVVVFVVKQLVNHKIQISIAKLLMLITLVAIVAALSLRFGFEWIASVLISIPASAPVLAFATYLRAAIAIFSKAMPSRTMGRFLFSMVGFLTGWAVSWRLAVNVVLVEYQRLPTTNPNCYVSGAAAYGHAFLVRAKRISNIEGDIIYINRQMQLLKFLELVILGTSPRIHFRLRSAYDRIGPPIANFCRRSKLFSDLVYLSLVPLELSAEALRRMLRVPRPIIDEFWRGTSNIGSCLDEQR